MRADFKNIIQFEAGYVDLSEKLRDELELKIDKVYAQNRFNHYINNQSARFVDSAKADFLCSYLLGKAPKDFVLSGELLQGIKTWFNMYDADRLSVIDKFRACYQNIIPMENANENRVVPIVFCKFLISELLSILAESRWQNLLQHETNYRQILYN
jgi:hypothetical protein